MSHMVACPLGPRCLTGNKKHVQGSQALAECQAAGNGGASAAESVEEVTAGFRSDEYRPRVTPENITDDTYLDHLDNESGYYKLGDNNNGHAEGENVEDTPNTNQLIEKDDMSGVKKFIRDFEPVEVEENVYVYVKKK